VIRSSKVFSLVRIEEFDEAGTVGREIKLQGEDGMAKLKFPT
jgi:hypothetical protein